MIYCVSTQLQLGKGGISTALTGLREAEALKQHGITFVTSHSGANKLKYFFQSIICLAKHAKNEDVIWLHCGNWLSMLRKFLLALVGKAKGAKVVFHFHTQTMDRYLEHSIFRLFITLLCRFSDGVVVLTPWWKKRFLAVIPSLEDKILVLPNPLDQSLVEAASFDRQDMVEDDKVSLLAMSRLVPGKGFEASIRALEKLPEHYNLTIAGDGPLLSTLQSLSEELGLTHRIKFLGWVDYQQKKAVFERHRVFLLPSSYDSFGMGFIEAMAYGLPVVALNFQATPDVVLHDQTGILCESDDPQQIATAVIACVEREYEMKPMCKQHVLSAFNNEKIALNALKFFEKI